MSGGPSDVERLVAIDVQVHAARNHDEPRDPATLEVLEAAGRNFGGHGPQPSARLPLITPDRWRAGFEKLPIRGEVRPLGLKRNAARLLGLEH